jgi:alkylated DNA repair dioxygenase AlkB
LFATIKQQLNWRQEYINLFNKTLPLPRLTAWYGDPGLIYTYSGIHHRAQGWQPDLKAIKATIETYLKGQPKYLSELNQGFNSVLANYYRTGQDSMGWHSDDEATLGDQPAIAVLSLGGWRDFKLRHKQTQEIKKLRLTGGSLLIMQGELQQYWQHSLAKTRRDCGERISLTYRNIVS